MIGDYLSYYLHTHGVLKVLGGKESGTYVSTYLGLQPAGVRPTCCAPHGRAPVLESKIGKRRKFLYLSAEPKYSPLALEALHEKLVRKYVSSRRR